MVKGKTKNKVKMLPKYATGLMTMGPLHIVVYAGIPTTKLVMVVVICVMTKASW